jgi:acetylornithine deacetylase/succinyl-diaminopimelate desuccinylase-like protein
MMIRFLPLLLLTFLCTCVSAQKTLNQRTLESLDTYQQFLSMPNDARIDGQLEPNLVWLEAEFGKRGFKTQRLKNEGIDLLLLTYPVAGAKETVLFYGHVDGQPVDVTKWVLSPPFKPVFGRMETGSDGTVKYAKVDKLPATG